MNKTIGKIESYKAKEIEKAISKAKANYEDARDCFSDTGYDRYFNKMEKAEKEIQELEEYLTRDSLEPKDVTTEQYKEYLEMKNDLKSIKAKVFYIISDLSLPVTADICNLQDILRKYS